MNIVGGVNMQDYSYNFKKYGAVWITVGILLSFIAFFIIKTTKQNETLLVARIESINKMDTIINNHETRVSLLEFKTSELRSKVIKLENFNKNNE
jgi:hypothetical protein